MNPFARRSPPDEPRIAHEGVGPPRAVVTALAAGGAGVWFYTQGKKPQRARLEPLIVREAVGQFPDEGRTFITNDKYLDLVDRGIIG